MRLLLLTLILIFPYAAQAAVSITEVAWMGSSDSANHEWIELYNDGVAVDVSNWQLSDGVNLNVTLSGTIPAQSYVVLERTSDVSAPGSAFLIYTGALSNGGATLSLRDAQGGTVDAVVGGENWQRIGGDNETKATAQRTAAGWITGAATPGQGAGGVAAPTPTTEDASDSVETTETSKSTDTRTRTTTTSDADNDSTAESIVLTLPDVTLQLDIRIPATVQVNEPLTFDVEPSGIGDTLIDSLVYQWNFGDGTIASGKQPLHSYAYPGTYAVVVAAEYKRQKQVAKAEIQVVPVQLSLAVPDDGMVLITNESDREVNLAEYVLEARQSMAFPKHTFILPGQTLRIDGERLGGVSDVSVILSDQRGDVVASRLPLATPQELVTPDDEVVTESVEAEPEPPVIETVPELSAIEAIEPEVEIVEQQSATPNPNFGFASALPSQPDTDEVEAEPPVTTELESTLENETVHASSQVAMLAGSGNRMPVEWPPYVLMAVLLAGVASIFFFPSGGRGV